MKRYQIKSCWLCGFLFVVLCLCIADMTSCAPKGTQNESLENASKWWETNEEIQILREYLKIPSVHPNPDYGEKFVRWSNFDFFLTTMNFFQNHVLSF